MKKESKMKRRQERGRECELTEALINNKEWKV